ncbi:MAG: hypothetical protein A2700_01085 [Candidatus Blackburnbacteria bacterium RIFCSPHIGHO2_01_FULL_44_64]|uniref:Uncharacterized protein n=1 Tax=Candidatus Blackburnbacteria bacterium RIFCSPHIGHO2_02_FULL_44_20 TaxID=1797516 RepID=A0A1G1V5I5_9BACT|nr:MAG: hypothetical protein A2700_01085 [Candidatus Blackburnbacteria bacterium RIFCSPHIGHO2_01_FULL_44_64]OGY10670.1 MAG: hypothetical protein A3D26_00720 [Candidatus Blackburnbacteria bacterium RIFCSPHIGHO2_02_FULL_44_20]OGY11063.1 MAG: hypothetical protein A3E16_04635 [Candidatus Blackburnbacteria bacterium RIFCSPHIGHO2_12_FULL_44_25]OGY13448.1 MAG: hypothetical protein A3A62_03005 [Candidatus Blackburnbacteria bacterium RIFCSPLOWO2_01_FULL_44_43]
MPKNWWQWTLTVAASAIGLLAAWLFLAAANDEAADHDEWEEITRGLLDQTGNTGTKGTHHALPCRRRAYVATQGGAVGAPR